MGNKKQASDFSGTKKRECHLQAVELFRGEGGGGRRGGREGLQALTHSLTCRLSIDSG